MLLSSIHISARSHFEEKGGKEKGKKERAKKRGNEIPKLRRRKEEKDEGEKVKRFFLLDSF